MFETGVRGQESVRLNPSFGETVECTAEEDMARQEYALQADLAYQVQRFGVGVHPVYGDAAIESMSLQDALAIVNDSRDAWLRLPKPVRDRYHSWAAVEDASRTGELEQLLKAAGIVGAEVAPTKPAASASDSAADGGSNA